MTQKERKIITELLYQIETLRSWLEDTSYPQRSRQELEKIVKEAKKEFKLCTK